jgi:monovalent cation:H+ antiporter-2, CPA2 family
MLEQELMSLGLLFLFAIIGGLIAVKFKQPAVIGLLLIGAIVGPNALNLVKDKTIIDMVAELGSILLLFVVGLEFVIPKLVKIGFKALLIGVMKIGIVFFLIYESALLFGLSQLAALVLGIMLSISSTVVIVKILESKGLYDRQEMPLLIGILIMEDIFAVIVLTFLSGAKGKSGVFPILENLIIAMTILLVAYLIMIRFSKMFVPFLLKEGNEEITTFIALGTCAGFSYLAYALGLQPATGAFLAGSIVASLSEVKKFESAIKPYSLTFSSLFFISIGTMVDFNIIKENILLISVLLVVIIISRFLSVGMVSYLFANFNRQQMIFSSMAMVSVGEFSLLIAQAASRLDLGIDLVSIAAFIIFVTALIMSISISYYENLTSILVTTPMSAQHKPRSFSNFMRILTEEIDTENTNSTELKNTFLTSTVNILFIFFIFILWQKLQPLFAGNTLMIYALHFVFAISMCIMVYMIYSRTKHGLKVLCQIITNLYSGSSNTKSEIIVSNLLLSLMLLLITIFSPILIVLFKLPGWINVITFLLLIFMVFRFKRLFNIVHHTSKSIYFPKYKKVKDIKFNFDRTD